MSNVESLCGKYLAALNAGDLEGVLALFATDGTVSSPLYGQMKAVDFYASLFDDTGASDTRLLNVFPQSMQKPAVALHFSYGWTLTNGEQVAFECVDVFDLTEDRERFQHLSIIYDTAPLRAAFYRSSGRPVEHQVGQ